VIDVHPPVEDSDDLPLTMDARGVHRRHTGHVALDDPARCKVAPRGHIGRGLDELDSGNQGQPRRVCRGALDQDLHVAGELLLGLDLRSGNRPDRLLDQADIGPQERHDSEQVAALGLKAHALGGGVHALAQFGVELPARLELADPADEIQSRRGPGIGPVQRGDVRVGGEVIADANARRGKAGPALRCDRSVELDYEASISGGARCDDRAQVQDRTLGVDRPRPEVEGHGVALPCAVVLGRNGGGGHGECSSQRQRHLGLGTAWHGGNPG
jgi:hypothetical protein